MELRKLHEDIWEEGGLIRRWDGSTYTSYLVRRRLTVEEWRELWRTVDEERLAVVVQGTNYGFRFGLMIYQLPEAPGAPPEFMIHIDWLHLSSFVDTDTGPYNKRFDAVWEFCRPYFDTPLNAERVELCGFPPNRDADYYRY